jgi:hypothetical protein
LEVIAAFKRLFPLQGPVGGIESGERFALSGKGQPDMKRNVPYAIIIPIAVVCFAVVLMLWSMAGTNGGSATRPGETTGSAYTRPNEMPVQAPTAPS